MTSPEKGGQPPWSLILDEVTGALETLGRVLDYEDDFNILLRQTCEQVVRAVSGVDEATVTLLRDDNPRTAATTSELVAELDHDQYRGGDGPCLEAAKTGQLVRRSMSEAQRRWPSFAADVEAAGFGSVLSAPLMVDSQHSGAINCYSADGHGFADLDVQLLELYTTAVETVLRTHQRYTDARDLATQLGTALESRAVIDQAKGIIMAIHQVSADDAFTLLVEHSQRENRKVPAMSPPTLSPPSSAKTDT